MSYMKLTDIIWLASQVMWLDFQQLIKNGSEIKKYKTTTRSLWQWNPKPNNEKGYDPFCNMVL